ncbi:cytochrome P450 [Aspergillus clavatus NRRL 1]|uniref:Cytochrome P450 oxidoreductase, putative n=1 Tax=Aspergillus clavatus (strain ATCC 1007 / CBS 513.65 / DSM 816 / NCTC 3887 / NRRL 1 / QM 1276 / 107) TaxID=344612 RepID=A1CD47_ASPCL|nr:Cytochrome P450 oxidoreductase, putative [Aspergillus clavatus NRRL 1]EAW12454.1 Cytochrome P450 oxidoreductase, putative [Aspergillus clavatus NRRL 1]
MDVFFSEWSKTATGWSLLLFLGALPCLFGLYLCFVAPPRHPQQIPSVPFWVTLLPFFFDVDQQETFQQYIAKPLQTHGAIKMFFAGRWNVIVQRPAMLAEIFRNEHIYHKSGNQEKIPHSVLAEYLGNFRERAQLREISRTDLDLRLAGSNIISARGDEWRRYRAVIQPGLQTSFDSSAVFRHAQRLSAVLLGLQERNRRQGVPVQGVLQRYSSANLLRCVLGLSDLSMIKMDQDAPLHSIQTSLKRYLFQPIFLNFPVLDWLGWAIPSRRQARNLIQDFSTELQMQIVQAHPPGSSTTSVGGRLATAWRDGTLTTQQFRDNLNVLYVAGHENPQLLLTSALYLLGKFPKVQERLRAEIEQYGTIDEGDTPTVSWERLPYLSATILECARLFPPISQLINRRVATPTWLAGNLHLTPGMYVGYHSYATNRDPTTWGPDADEFRPERWGHTHEQIFAAYRRAKARAEFITFHGGPRACLGEKFALLQMRVSLLVLVRSLSWTLDPEWTDQMMPAGPLHPRGLRLMFITHDKDAAT